ncbi:MAG: beta-N-acetylhexosaminidase [Vicinamibacterales bacterium]
MRCRSAILILTLSATVACTSNPPPTVTPMPSPLPAPSIRIDPGPLPLLPLPQHIERKPGEFPFNPSTVIYADDTFAPVARFLSEFIGLAFGAQPPRVEPLGAEPPGGAVVIERNTARKGIGVEGYELEITPSRISILADEPAGAFYGAQTLRQLLPAAFEYEALRAPRGNPPLVALPALLIRDQPRFSWRGAMLDVARHFLTVEDVKRYLDLMALHKLNRLHLHLADDQGWRIEIKSWPRLTVHGGSTEVGGGPGGFYTQDQYAVIVRYAADRFITIVPEIDMPGHTNAALSSYAELNCDGVARPLFTGIDVGFSALCVEKEITYTFIDDVVREIASITPGPYFHIGGDEVKTLSAQQYQGFIDRVQTIVRSHGKQMVGWDEIAPASLQPSSIIQHWRPKTTPAEGVAKGAKVIMSVASRTYLDMKYDTSTPIGLTWAGIVPIQTSYDWDPATIAEAVPESSVLGVEGPLWSETLSNIRDVEYLAFPRLAALAEAGWTAQSSRRWEEFRLRLGRQNARWTALGLNFHRSPEIDWK